MGTVVHLLLLLVPGIGATTTPSSHTFQHRSARNYLSVTSENYPGSYPSGPEWWRWRWSVGEGLWALIFLDFDLTCSSHSASTPFLHDTLVVTDHRRTLTFTCGNSPTLHYAYVIESPEFTLQLNASGQRDRNTAHRGFKCQVLYGATRGELRAMIDDMETNRDSQDSKGECGAHPSLSTLSTALIPLLAVVVPLIVIVVMVVVGVVMWRMMRRRQQGPPPPSTANTSVHLNIGGVRRQSSISYTRHGNGPSPGEARSRDRLTSDASLTSTTTTPPPGAAGRRPDKRSASNASWAVRAEMTTTTVRTTDPEERDTDNTGDNSSGNSSGEGEGTGGSVEGGGGRRRGGGGHDDSEVLLPHSDPGSHPHSHSGSPHPHPHSQSGPGTRHPSGTRPHLTGPHPPHQSGPVLHQCGPFMGGRRGDNKSNLYSPYPGSMEDLLSSQAPSSSGGEEGMTHTHPHPKHHHPLHPHAHTTTTTTTTCRLSSVFEEEPGTSCAKLTASFPVPVSADDRLPSLAVANAGYMVMTSCSASAASPSSHYANCDQV